MLHHIEGDATASVKAPGVPEVATERQGARERGREKVSIVASSTDERAPFPPPHPPPPSRRALRALFCTLEFSAENFSGNGTLAQACVRGLASAGVDVVVAATTPTHNLHSMFQPLKVSVFRCMSMGGCGLTPLCVCVDGFGFVFT